MALDRLQHTIGKGTMNDTERTHPMAEEEVLSAEIKTLLDQHRALDDEISALEEGVHRDTLTIRRLKKEKLVLKDQIEVLKDRVTPDIIA